MGVVTGMDVQCGHASRLFAAGVLAERLRRPATAALARVRSVDPPWPVTFRVDGPLPASVGLASAAPAAPIADR